MDKTPQSDWKKIDAIFDDVLDAAESDREEIVLVRCGDNAEFAERVRALLKAANVNDDTFENPSFDDLIEDLDVDPLSHPIGKRISKYTVCPQRRSKPVRFPSDCFRQRRFATC